MFHNQSFMGTGFFWWQGVVEDRHDEDADDGLKLGRVRVRILGVHSPDYVADDEAGEGIEVGQLRWAYPMMPVTSAGVDGIGQTPLGVVDGTWVFGFSRDGEFSQDLVIMGTAGGFQEEAKNPDYEGFCDPALNDGGLADGRPEVEYREHIYPNQLGETYVNRLATGDERHHILDIKELNRVPFIFNPIALDGVWDQPDIQYEAEYPYNHVKETEGGHIEEYDDTPGKERTHKWHKSGSYVETYSDGKRTQQTVSDDHETIMGNKHVVALEDVTITAYGKVKVLSVLDNVDIQAAVDVNIVAGRAINLAAPLITETSGTHVLTTGGYSIQSAVTNHTTGVYNIYSPITNIYGNLFVLMHTQSGTMGTNFLWAGFIVTGGCAGCC